MSVFESLSYKQYLQLVDLCKEFQPYLPFDEVVFLELVTVARIYCDKNMFPFRGNTKEERFQKILTDDYLKRIKGKYYFNGIKTNKNELSIQHLTKIRRYVPRVKMPSFGYNDPRNYRPIEKILFVKIVRACRDFMRARMSKKAEQAFFDKLSVVFDAM